MTLSVTPHLNFRGDARAALDLYRTAFGGEATLVTHGQLESPVEPEEADWIVWGQVAAPNGFRVMAFDVPSARPWDQGVDSAFVSVRGTDAAEATRSFEVLSEGATVRQPIGPSPWSPLYGMLTDRFGVTWVMDLDVDQAA